ncbi:HNH endonuclease [Vibrio phage 526E57-1]
MFEGWTYNDKGDLFRPNGKLCSRNPNSDGYLAVKLDYKSFLQHRIVFFLHNGYWPTEVDHKDRDKLNNAPNNLRDATRSEQNHNKCMYKNNTSGVKGVAFDKRRGKWYAQLKVNGVRHKAFCCTLQDAVTKRKEFEDTYA